MDKSLTTQIDQILKANNAKGIGHLSRNQRAKILCLGEIKSRTQFKKFMAAWLKQFADRTPGETNGPESAARS